ncbi:MAG TPA: VWA domain-containing protein [Bryobacteraceae bacterium]|nr:VWA domain-containing protein [Bryobacteraceae bacterium]
MWLAASVLAAQAPEITTKDSAVTFKSGVNLVDVPVVVRDSRGRAVGDLGVDDFRVLDNGKPQTISKFRVEHLAARAPADSANSEAVNPGAAGGAATDAMPGRFIAYVFDDVHMSLGDLAPTREAARKRIDSLPAGNDRMAIFSLSGNTMTEFTGDRAKLDAALDNLSLRAATVEKSVEQNSCPPVTYYQANLINDGDGQALQSAATDALTCLHLHDPKNGPTRDEFQAAQSAARRALGRGEQDSVISFDGLFACVSRMAAMPGQRLMVLVSNGFPIMTRDHEEVSRLIDRAVQAGVVVSALDARGLYTASAAGDASDRTITLGNLSLKTRYSAEEAEAQLTLMASLADGTGGTFYHGLNDFNEGLARITAVPEYLYVLGFHPADLKLDGNAHTLRVTLKAPKGLSVEARKQYYAAAYAATPAEQAKRQIEEAFFSREEVHDAPAELQTQYFEGSDGKPMLSTVVRIDVSKLGFQREADRNENRLTVTTGVFDSDGNYVTGVQKTVDLRLQDATLKSLESSGVAVKSSFAVQPGRYLVRMVVVDAQDQTLSAESGQIEIP